MMYLLWKFLRRDNLSIESLMSCFVIVQVPLILQRIPKKKKKKGKKNTEKNVNFVQAFLYQLFGCPKANSQQYFK